MAKLYKVRKKCMICGGIFYPRYAGSLYCETCKSKKVEIVPVKSVKPAKKTVKKTVPKAVKKTVKKPAKKIAKPSKKPAKAAKAKKSKK